MTTLSPPKIKKIIKDVWAGKVDNSGVKKRKSKSLNRRRRLSSIFIVFTVNYKRMKKIT